MFPRDFGRSESKIIHIPGHTRSLFSEEEIVSAVNIAEVYTKYEIGRYIVEDEQRGEYKTTYGAKIIVNLSSRLTERYGNGWSIETLKKARLFYATYCAKKIGSTALTQSLPGADDDNQVHSADPIQNAPTAPHKFVLSWSHYLILMRVDNPDARSFYEIEAAKENWSVRWLQRQVASSLYERIALSTDKDKVAKVATEGQTIQKPSDIIKNPITLEFLGLKPEAAYSESKLENGIISKMQTWSSTTDCCSATF